MIVNGQRNKVLLDINNKDKTSYTVFAISGQVTKADDFSSVVRNVSLFIRDGVNGILICICS